MFLWNKRYRTKAVIASEMIALRNIDSIPVSGRKLVTWWVANIKAMINKSLAMANDIYPRELV